MFEIGQFVYTNRQICGWFNFSARHAIPENTRGTIVAYAVEGKTIEDTLYDVEFEPEFGIYTIKHTDLKLG